MYKLSGHSLTRESFFLPESQGLILQERDSTSTITLGPEAPDIEFNDWLMDDDLPGGNIMIWRVKSISDQTNADTRTIELEHVIKTLDDTSLFEEVTTEDISGGSTATAGQAIAYLLGRQADWRLGDFMFSDTNAYEFSAGETLLDAISSVTDTLDEAQWDYDMSVYPFILHVRLRNQAIDCEMRGGRNLSTLKRSVSRSGMYTRFYPIGKNDLHISTSYISKNEGLYGRVDKIETNTGKSTEGSLLSWAWGRLNKHCEPTVSITISGLELYAETGEPMDRLRLNTVCRCPLPEYATTITERIVKIQWRDRMKEPENITVTLCNSSADIATIIKESSRSSGSAAAGQAKQNWLFEANENHLYYEVFDDCGHLHGLLEMTKESLRIDFNNQLESTRSELLMTSESLRIMFENDITSARSEFEMTAQSLRVEFSNTTSSLRTLISAEAGKIQQIVEAVGSNGQVTAASIILAINDDTSSAKISADEIDINGIVSALQTKSISVGSLTVEGATDFLQGVYSEGNIASDADIDATGKLKASGGIWDQSSGNVRLMVSNITKNNAGDTITVSFVDGTSWDFSKAASSIKLSGEWSGTASAGKSYKIFQDPSGSSTLPLYSPALDGMALNASSKTWAADYKSFDQEVSVYDENGEDLYKETLTFNTAAAFNAGARSTSSVTLSGEWSGNLTGKSFKVTASPSGVVTNAPFYSPAIDGIAKRSGTVVWASNYKSYTQDIYVYDANGVELIEENLTFTCTGAWNNGNDTVTLKDPTVNSATGTPTSRTFTVETSGKRSSQLSKTITVTPTASVSGGKAYASVHWGSSTGTTIASASVNLPAFTYSASSSSTSAYSGDKSYSLNPNYRYHKFTVTCGGKTETVAITILSS